MIQSLSAFISSLIGTLPGIVLFVALFWFEVAHDTIPILMYRGIVLAGMAGVAQGILLGSLLRRHPYKTYLLLSATSLALAANLIFLVVFPVTIDRSVSVYLLGQLSKNPKGMTEVELNERLIHQYVEQYQGVNRRMQEQISSGNVQIAGERYLLTPQGRTFIQFCDSVIDIFGVDPRFIRASESNPTLPQQ